MSGSAQLRAELVAFLEKDLIGPAGGPEELLEDPPRIRYGAGVLFPQDALRNESEAVAGVEGDGASVEETEVTDEEAIQSISEDSGDRDADEPTDYDDTVTLANTYRPSAMGLSFMTSPRVVTLRVQARAAVYETLVSESDDGYKVTIWKRKELALDPVTVDLAMVAKDGKRDWRLTDGLHLRGVFRPRSDQRCLTTFSLYNAQNESKRGADTFFQVGFIVDSPETHESFVEYRVFEGLGEDEEELRLEMLYRNRRVFAAGHGCAADWEPSRSDTTRWVSTSVLPSVLVPPVVAVSGPDRYLSMQFLSGDCPRPATAIPEALENFCSDYQQWIAARCSELEEIAPRFRDAAEENLAACKIALERMKAGVRLIARDARAFEAFTLANKVMLMQQYHSRLRRKLDDAWSPLPDRADGYQADWGSRRGYWRTFQIAFLLTLLPGLVPNAETVMIGDREILERDLVDLIWFPTGGGKTEAYLAVTAFLIFNTRLHNSDESGCKILMRYTLRLLTSQQFQRASSMICACELIRRDQPQRFGENPISIGLWVGMSLTPNDQKEALRALDRMESKPDEARNPFQLLTCPWCGTELNNPVRYGYVEKKGQQIFVCPSEAAADQEPCPFTQRKAALPISVVDEAIYAQPPTLIIGTVDKFAMLSWRDAAGAIFSQGPGIQLIIQDELHLISGPLGSMVGLYEGAIDFLSSKNGRRPKIIASTATIRRAAEQCRSLYDREMIQFPPQGLEASDSYFAKEESSAPGRLYVGFLPTAASSPLTAQIRSVVALLQGATMVADADAADEDIDPFWTLVQYFGSLKELGRAATFITADIPEFLPTMHRRYGLEGDARRWMRSSEELTSRKNEDEIPQILKQLERPFRRGAGREEQALDTVLATVMISVGVDVDRLGMMMIVTQPKGTSEYIQASSRVGRACPGLVFTLYNAGRPRDRSHYEQFRAYHEAFYRFVEPTSVTPFAPPAMERALHAVLVIGGRHVAGWKTPQELDLDDPKFSSFLDMLRARVEGVDPEHLREFEDILGERLSEWRSRGPRIWGDLSGYRDEPALMRPAGAMGTDEDRFSWETPTSMRNVDVECQAEVVARYLLGGDSS